MRYPSKDQLDRAKISLEIVAYVAVVTLIVVAIWNAEFFIERIGKSFKAAGWKIDEINLVGAIKFKVTDTLAAAQTTAEDLKSARELVACQSRSNCSPEQVAAVQRIVSEVVALNAATTRVQQEIRETIRQSEQVVQRVEQQIAAPSPIAPRGDGAWIAVVGADRALSGAQHEVRKIKDAYPRTEILFADNWYRTVVRFDTEAEARAALPRLAELTDRQPYVRNFNEWCPRAVSAGTGFTQCGSRAS